MGTTNDQMFTALSVLYPNAGATLGDLLSAYWVENGLQYRGALQVQYYKDAGAVGDTWGDVANAFWSDGDFVVSNLELEDGTDFLLEDGSFILMEVGNG